nr:tripartite motif-containing protein 16-like [Misgurnus anguillicaudatus]
MISQESTQEQEDVDCGVCTETKCKAVKSCLECLNSYCEDHLKYHENLFKDRPHSLINPTRRLHEMICQKHRRYLEIYCRTDQQCICYTCTMDDHKNHETVTVAEEKIEKQRHLRETQWKFQQRIQKREKELREVREAVQSHQRSVQTAVKDNERIFNELMTSIKKTRSEVTRLIRDQEKAALSQAERLMKQLEEEISDLKERNDHLEQLSHKDDLIQFMQQFQIYSAAPEPTVSHNITHSSLLSFDDVKKSLSQLKEKLEDFCKEEIEEISDGVSYITIVRPNIPRTRKEFLQYFRQFTLDSNTANNSIGLIDGDRTATDCDTTQQYSYDPERFDYCPQVLCKESVSGRCYWEVEWSGSNGVYISVSYKTISKKSFENESLFGNNNQSWSLYCCSSRNFPSSSSHQLSLMEPPRAGDASGGVYPNQSQAIARKTQWTRVQFNSMPLKYSVVHNSQITELPVSSGCSRIGVFVDHSAGTLSFYSISDTMTLIHRFQTTFTQPLYPGFTVFKGSTVKLCHHTE